MSKPKIEYVITTKVGELGEVSNDKSLPQIPDPPFKHQPGDHTVAYDRLDQSAQLKKPFGLPIPPVVVAIDIETGKAKEPR